MIEARTDVRYAQTVFIFTNGMIAVADQHGEQIPELQGPDTPELRSLIRSRALPSVEWNEH